MVIIYPDTSNFTLTQKEVVKVYNVLVDHTGEVEESYNPADIAASPAPSFTRTGDGAWRPAWTSGLRWTPSGRSVGALGVVRPYHQVQEIYQGGPLIGRDPVRL